MEATRRRKRTYSARPYSVTITSADTRRQSGCVYVYEEGFTTNDPFDAETLYPPLLARAIVLCREKRLPVDMAEDFVQETYIRFRVVDHDGFSRAQNYSWLRRVLHNLIEDVRLRKESVIHLWASSADESLDELAE